MKKDLENQIGDISKELENIYLPHDAVLILLGKRTAFGIALKLVDSLRQKQMEALKKAYEDAFECPEGAVPHLVLQSLLSDLQKLM